MKPSSVGNVYQLVNQLGRQHARNMALSTFSTNAGTVAKQLSGSALVLIISVTLAIEYGTLFSLLSVKVVTNAHSMVSILLMEKSLHLAAKNARKKRWKS
jgi:hypothetical protein